MSDVHCRTVWISDVHLGTRECAAEALLTFLDRHQCEYLYLVGDIIDFWQIARMPHWPQLHSDVIRKVLSKARTGTIVTLIPGNHDEYLRRFCDLQLGNIMVTAEAIHRTADGRLLLVLHGDEFDGAARYYRALARASDLGFGTMVALNRWINGARRWCGFGYWSLSASLASMLERAAGVAGAFESAVVREAARRRVGGVVCGHVHRAALHAVGSILYCNTGDWVESCTALIEHFDGRLELVAAASGAERAGTSGRTAAGAPA
jgi:UDP-2,3-diacylglucosamine pyrophosphatase LpxH